MTQSVLKAPFPAFGGKSRVAGVVWPRLTSEQNPARNYIEPFCFSAAMLLLRPDDPQIETINDLNAYVANFWRAVRADPVAVAEHADWPVNETDLHARHAWLVRSHEAAEKLQRVRDEPEYFDAKIAGWWCWGACMWIGSGWCESASQQIPILRGGVGQGVNAAGESPKIWEGRGTALQNPRHIYKQEAGEYEPPLGKRPQLNIGNSTRGNGVHKHEQDVVSSDMGYLANKRPRIHGGGGADPPGVHSAMVDGRLQLADAYSRGRGIHGNDSLSDCDRRRLWLIDWFQRLSDRLRPVRVCCGHWARVCDSDSTLTRLGKTAVFLDPPYRTTLADGTVNRADHIYANDKSQNVNGLVDEVQQWCLKWGDNRDIRIAVCGLEGEYPLLAHWEQVAWKSQGGYGNRNKDNQNAARERIWFSPHCLKPERERMLWD